MLPLNLSFGQVRPIPNVDTFVDICRQSLTKPSLLKQSQKSSVVASVLSSFSIFSSLPSEIVRDIARTATVVNYAQNRVICEKGEKLSCMYIVVDGRVGMHNTNNPTHTQPLRTKGRSHPSQQSSSSSLTVGGQRLPPYCGQGTSLLDQSLLLGLCVLASERTWESSVECMHYLRGVTHTLKHGPPQSTDNSPDQDTITDTAVVETYTSHTLESMMRVVSSGGHSGLTVDTHDHSVDDDGGSSSSSDVLLGHRHPYFTHFHRIYNQPLTHTPSRIPPRCSVECVNDQDDPVLYSPFRLTSLSDVLLLKVSQISVVLAITQHIHAWLSCRLTLLRQCDIFATRTDTDIQAVLRWFTMREYGYGDVLPLDPSVVVKGSVHTFVRPWTDTYRQPHMLVDLYKGDNVTEEVDVDDVDEHVAEVQGSPVADDEVSIHSLLHRMMSLGLVDQPDNTHTHTAPVSPSFPTTSESRTPVPPTSPSAKTHSTATTLALTALRHALMTSLPTCIATTQPGQSFGVGLDRRHYGHVKATCDVLYVCATERVLLLTVDRASFDRYIKVNTRVDKPLSPPHTHTHTVAALAATLPVWMLSLHESLLVTSLSCPTLIRPPMVMLFLHCVCLTGHSLLATVLLQSFLAHVPLMTAAQVDGIRTLWAAHKDRCVGHDGVRSVTANTTNTAVVSHTSRGDGVGVAKGRLQKRVSAVEAIFNTNNTHTDKDTDTDTETHDLAVDVSVTEDGDVLSSSPDSMVRQHTSTHDSTALLALAHFFLSVSLPPLRFTLPPSMSLLFNKNTNTPTLLSSLPPSLRWTLLQHGRVLTVPPLHALSPVTDTHHSLFVPYSSVLASTDTQAGHRRRRSSVSMVGPPTQTPTPNKSDTLARAATVVGYVVLGGMTDVICVANKRRGTSIDVLLSQLNKSETDSHTLSQTLTNATTAHDNTRGVGAGFVDANANTNTPSLPLLQLNGRSDGVSPSVSVSGSGSTLASSSSNDGLSGTPTQFLSPTHARAHAHSSECRCDCMTVCRVSSHPQYGYTDHSLFDCPQSHTPTPPHESTATMFPCDRVDVVHLRRVTRGDSVGLISVDMAQSAVSRRTQHTSRRDRNMSVYNMTGVESSGRDDVAHLLQTQVVNPYTLVNTSTQPCVLLELTVNTAMMLHHHLHSLNHDQSAQRTETKTKPGRATSQVPTSTSLPTHPMTYTDPLFSSYQFLRTHPDLSSLSDAQVVQLSLASTQMNVRSGVCVCEQNKMSEGVYFIVSGSVTAFIDVNNNALTGDGRMSTGTSDSDDISNLPLLPLLQVTNSMFGHASLLALLHPQVYISHLSCSYVTTTACQLLYINATRLYSLLNKSSINTLTRGFLSESSVAAKTHTHNTDESQSGHTQRQVPNQHALLQQRLQQVVSEVAPALSLSAEAMATRVLRQNADCNTHALKAYYGELSEADQLHRLSQQYTESDKKQAGVANEPVLGLGAFTTDASANQRPVMSAHAALTLACRLAQLTHTHRSVHAWNSLFAQVQHKIQYLTVPVAKEWRAWRHQAVVLDEFRVYEADDDDDGTHTHTHTLVNQYGYNVKHIEPTTTTTAIDDVATSQQPHTRTTSTLTPHERDQLQQRQLFQQQQLEKSNRARLRWKTLLFSLKSCARSMLVMRKLRNSVDDYLPPLQLHAQAKLQSKRGVETETSVPGYGELSGRQWVGDFTVYTHTHNHTHTPLHTHVATTSVLSGHAVGSTDPTDGYTQADADRDLHRLLQGKRLVRAPRVDHPVISHQTHVHTHHRPPRHGHGHGESPQTHTQTQSQTTASVPKSTRHFTLPRLSVGLDVRPSLHDAAKSKRHQLLQRRDDEIRRIVQAELHSVLRKYGEMSTQTKTEHDDTDALVDMLMHNRGSLPLLGDEDDATRRTLDVVKPVEQQVFVPLSKPRARNTGSRHLHRRKPSATMDMADVLSLVTQGLPPSVADHLRSQSQRASATGHAIDVDVLAEFAPSNHQHYLKQWLLGGSGRKSSADAFKPSVSAEETARRRTWQKYNVSHMVSPLRHNEHDNQDDGDVTGRPSLLSSTGASVIEMNNTRQTTTHTPHTSFPAMTMTPTSIKSLSASLNSASPARPIHTHHTPTPHTPERGNLDGSVQITDGVVTAFTPHSPTLFLSNQQLQQIIPRDGTTALKVLTLTAKKDGRELGRRTRGGINHPFLSKRQAVLGQHSEDGDDDSTQHQHAVSTRNQRTLSTKTIHQPRFTHSQDSRSMTHAFGDDNVSLMTIAPLTQYNKQ